MYTCMFVCVLVPDYIHPGSKYKVVSNLGSYKPSLCYQYAQVHMSLYIHILV